MRFSPVLFFFFVIVTARAQDGLTGLYYDNPSFLGEPPIVRVDPAIDFDGAFAPEDKDSAFSAVWTGQVRAVEGGAYGFHLRGAGGARLWIGGREISKPGDWRQIPAGGIQGALELAAGKRYEILAYHHGQRESGALFLEWTRPSGVREVIGQARLSSYGSEGVGSGYIDPEHLVRLPFGSHSHYLQPWRAWMETRSAASFLAHIGVVSHAGKYSAAVSRHLAENGVTTTRFEVGWGNVDYDDPARLLENKAGEIGEHLRNLRKNGIRPAILLNSHHSWPCPNRNTNRIILADAPAGARALRLETTGGIVPGRTQLNSFDTSRDTGPLITAVAGETVTLSKPLPRAAKAGEITRTVALKYRPFTSPDLSQCAGEWRETLDGWGDYVLAIGKAATEALGTAGKADAGFDLDVWNELTFGSNFLRINRYYDPPLYPELGNESDRVVPYPILQRTVEVIAAHPEYFSGVRVNNGFSNQRPWDGANGQPAGVHSLGGHPYPGRKSYPDNERENSRRLDAHGKPTDFVPSYSIHFPEYTHCALQTETLARNAAPLPNDIYRRAESLHGRFSRLEGEPVPLWFTETGFSPAETTVEGRPDTVPGAPGGLTRQRALDLKGKAALRFYCFLLNKGVENITLFAADHHGDFGLSLVTEAFFEHIDRTGAYPPGDVIESLTSPALRFTRNLTREMRRGLDPGLKTLRAIQVLAITDDHGHFQFEGDGTAANPNLLNRDVLAALPYQVNANAFAIACYVMTRDITRDLPPETYRITLAGIDRARARVRLYDPVGDRDAPVEVLGGDDDTITLELSLTDTPRLLLIDDSERR